MEGRHKQFKYFKYVYTRIYDHDIFALAAQLAYYLLLSIFPFLIFLITVISYTPITSDRAINEIAQLLPPYAEFVVEIIKQIVSARSIRLLSFGMILALWASSNGIVALMRGLNKAYGCKETRSFLKVRAISLVFTLVVALVFIFSLVLLVFGEIVGTRLFGMFGFSSLFKPLWHILSYLITGIALICTFTIIYYFMPNVKNEKITVRATLPGTILSTLGWILLSFLFASYIRHFPNFSKMYGSIGGIIAFLVWIYWSSALILFGAEINSSLYFIFRQNRRENKGIMGKFLYPAVKESKRKSDYRKKFTQAFLVIMSKVIIRLCRILNWGGTSIAGKIAFNIYPNIIRDMAHRFYIIVVTGTNGKTTTTKMIAEMLTLNNTTKFITNKSGANLINGIATILIESTKIRDIFAFKNKSLHKPIALLEVDEATFGTLTKHFEPNILVVTNFFRDQLDRYGELYTTLKKVEEGISRTKETKLILNSDDSLCSSLGRKLAKDRVFYYGMDKDSLEDVLLQDDNLDYNINSDAVFCIYCKNKYVYTHYTYGHLGGFECPNCGYKKMTTNITCTNVNQLLSSSSSIRLAINLIGNYNNASLKININLPGLYNIYNALAAITCAALMNIPSHCMTEALQNFESCFGRMETIRLDNKTIKIVLVKNPTGFEQVLDLIRSNPTKMRIAFAINDKSLDGIDISWLWDVNFEKIPKVLSKIDKIYTSGIRAEDMTVRLKYAGVPVNKIEIIRDYEELISDAVYNVSEEYEFYILPTYTAMMDMRKILKSKFNLKEFWE